MMKKLISKLRRVTLWLVIIFLLTSMIILLVSSQSNQAPAKKTETTNNKECSYWSRQMLGIKPGFCWKCGGWHWF